MPKLDGVPRGKTLTFLYVSTKSCLLIPFLEHRLVINDSKVSSYKYSNININVTVFTNEKTKDSSCITVLTAIIMNFIGAS